MNKKAKVGIIAAVSRNGFIGCNGKMPWEAVGKKLEGDLQHFSATTTGTGNNAIVMGRKTLESWGNKPLPNRVNTVLSRNPDYQPPEGVAKYASLSEAIMRLERTVDEIWICGGAEVYRQGLKSADMMVLTETYDDYEGDVEFPAVDPIHWTQVDRKAFPDRRYALVYYKRIG